MQLFLCNCFRS